MAIILSHVFGNGLRAMPNSMNKRRQFCISASKTPQLFSVAPMMEWTDNHFRMLARILSRHTWLYTEMIVAETLTHHEDNLERWLEFPACQHPIVLQLGGSNIKSLARAAQLAKSFNYDEINFNCGCPSSKVAGDGCFGARLMLSPELVGEAMQAISEEISVPVTVKCRIGVDDADSYDQLCEFISTVSSMSSTKHFIIHARKALLNGLSPAQNRAIPPLKYEYVLALIRDFPHLQFTLNGGITTINQVKEVMTKGVNGIMVGRAAYNKPWSILTKVDSCIYGKPSRTLTRRQVLHEYEEYASSVIGTHGENKPGNRLLVKPLMNLFYSEQGASLWRRCIDENLRHIMSFNELLKKTMAVIPDCVLDSPVSEEELTSDKMLSIAPLPPSPLTMRQTTS